MEVLFADNRIILLGIDPYLVPIQSFQKSLVKDYALNHLGTLIIVQGMFLLEGLLEALDNVEL